MQIPLKQGLTIFTVCCFFSAGATPILEQYQCATSDIEMVMLVVEKVMAKYKLRSDAVCFYRIWKTVGKGVAQYLLPFALTGSTLFVPTGRKKLGRGFLFIWLVAFVEPFQ